MLNVARNIKLSPDKLNEVLAASGVNSTRCATVCGPPSPGSR